MEPRAVLGIDCSTTSIKTIAWSSKGESVGQARRCYKTFNPRPTWYEQDAEDWWEGLCSCLRSLPRRLRRSRIEALCITNQRESFVLVDERCRPLRPAILWNDERSLPQLEVLERRFGAQRLHRLTGKPLSMIPALPKMLWLQEHEPQLIEKTAKFLDPHAFLLYRLTGVLATSLACADPQGLLDLAQGRWSEELIRALGFRVEQFPELYPPGAVIGSLNKEAAAATGLPAGLPVVAGAGDGQCAGLGVNAVSGGEAYLNLGTAVVSGLLSETYITDPAFRTLCSPIPNRYYLETVLKGGVFTAAWFLEKFASDLKSRPGSSREQLMEKEAARVPPGSLGLLLVPYWHNSASPYWDPAASGITIGWTGAHGRQHFYRAILEGVAFEQRLMSEQAMKALNRRIDTFLVLGGGSGSDLWCQILADVTGIALQRAAVIDATCLGAGILAASAVGWYPDCFSAARAMVRTGRRFTPNPQHQELYERLYTQVYRPLFPTLRTLIDRLTSLSWNAD